MDRARSAPTAATTSVPLPGFFLGRGSSASSGLDGDDLPERCREPDDDSDSVRSLTGALAATTAEGDFAPPAARAFFFWGDGSGVVGNTCGRLERMHNKGGGSPAATWARRRCYSKAAAGSAAAAARARARRRGTEGSRKSPGSAAVIRERAWVGRVSVVVVVAPAAAAAEAARVVVVAVAGTRRWAAGVPSTAAAVAPRGRVAAGRGAGAACDRRPWAAAAAAALRTKKEVRAWTEAAWRRDRSAGRRRKVRRAAAADRKVVRAAHAVAAWQPKRHPTRGRSTQLTPPAAERTEAEQEAWRRRRRRVVSAAQAPSSFAWTLPRVFCRRSSPTRAVASRGPQYPNSWACRACDRQYRAVPSC